VSETFIASSRKHVVVAAVICDVIFYVDSFHGGRQWRRQNLLRGGLKPEIRSLTADFRAGCSSGLMTNSFVTNAVLMERAVSC